MNRSVSSLLAGALACSLGLIGCSTTGSGGANPNNIDPDFNRDGNADQDDISALINVVAGGECP